MANNEGSEYKNIRIQCHRRCETVLMYTVAGAAGLFGVACDHVQPATVFVLVFIFKADSVEADAAPDGVFVPIVFVPAVG
uniref:Transmembrane protein n=1 Tax=Panagrellus redivivus TaxID=6233 RepID=A0A7E4VDJ0_PANRE